MKVVLLGPQRFNPSLAEAAEEVGARGKIAIVTAGWQEREPEDDELDAHLEGRTVNLELHRRAREVFAADEEFRQAFRERQIRYRQLQDFYRIRLEFLIQSAHVISHRAASEEVLAEEHVASVTAIRMLDRHHRRRCDRVRREFRQVWGPKTLDAVRPHRDEITSILEDCDALAIAGGHVATLINRLQLFDIAELIGERPVLAWSAGAMAITDHIVLFHDDPPYGVDAPQILDVGLGLVPNVVALPSPEERLALEDRDRMAMYAARFAPSTCLVLPRRSWVAFDGDVMGRAKDVRRLEADGRALMVGGAAA